MANYYFVYIKPKKNVALRQIESKMNLALDWFRLNESTWILYTNSSESKWYARLEQFIQNEGSLIICKLDTTNIAGSMMEEFWDWMEARTPAVKAILRPMRNKYLKNDP